MKWTALATANKVAVNRDKRKEVIVVPTSVLDEYNIDYNIVSIFISILTSPDHSKTK